MKPLVSVIIPCRNEAATLSRCLDSVLCSDYPSDRMEILVADGESEDSSRALLDYYAEHDQRLRWIDNPDRITPAALNRAIGVSRGDYILRVDAHSILAPDYVRAVVDFLETHSSAWGAGGRMITVPDGTGAFAEPIRIVLTSRFGVGNSRFRTEDFQPAEADSGEKTPQLADTVFNCCWRREVFDKVGWFHPQLARSQDIEFSSRIAAAGGTLWLVPAAQTTYFAKSRLASYVQHNWSNGVWSVLPAAYLGKPPVRWRHLVPLAFVTVLMFSMLLATIPGLRWLPAIVILPYAAVSLGVSFIAARRAGQARLAGLLPIAFAGLHFAYGAGSLWGCVLCLLHRMSPPAVTTVELPVAESSQALALGAAAGAASSHAVQPVYQPELGARDANVS